MDESAKNGYRVWRMESVSRMGSIRSVVLGVIALTLATVAGAEGSKIGFVNINLLLQKVPQATEAAARLESAFRDRKNDILGFQQKCKEMEEELKREELAMSQQQKQKELRRIRSCSSELKLMDEEYGADLRIAQAEELQNLQKLVYKVIDEIARAERYDLIVNESVIFASPQADISLKVLHQLEEQALQSSTAATPSPAKP